MSSCRSEEAAATDTHKLLELITRPRQGAGEVLSTWWTRETGPRGADASGFIVGER